LKRQNRRFRRSARRFGRGRIARQYATSELE
jgi:hypothetical protein